MVSNIYWNAIGISLIFKGYFFLGRTTDNRQQYIPMGTYPT